MKKVICTTTINAPTEAMLKFAAMEDWQLVIAGDLKTPHSAFRGLANSNERVTYLDPDDQAGTFPILSRGPSTRLGATCWNLMDGRRGSWTESRSSTTKQHRTNWKNTASHDP